jgi:two-component system nitrate/nitrite response regulator NarL
MVTNSATTLIVVRPGSLQNGLLALTTAIPRVKVVGEASDAASALRMVSEHRPALVLLDTGLPGNEAWMVLGCIKRDWPQTRCIVLAGDVKQQREAGVLGADVTLLEGAPPARLVAAIEQLMSH